MKLVYWSRELAGWALIACGLWFFWEAYLLVMNKRLFAAAPTVFIAFIIFRGGVHFLKVAVAAQAARSLAESYAQPPTRMASRMAGKSYAPTPVQAVMPGPRSRSIGQPTQN
ncbi:MAG: hypothetical protein RMJ56_00630 [Gemmataceae bacterium]|nr:hypothetical protein [Gemmata sp.]MDW8196085.1 hypothetical protein [Gemmataceae bacterium]